jgi:hypothetical protein
MDGEQAPAAGIHFPEKGANTRAALQLLRDNGVQIKGLSLVTEQQFAKAV